MTNTSPYTTPERLLWLGEARERVEREEGCEKHLAAIMKASQGKGFEVRFSGGRVGYPARLIKERRDEKQ